MAKNISISPSVLEDQATRLQKLAGQISDIHSKASRAIALIHEATNSKYSSDMKQKGNKLLQNANHLSDKLYEGAKIAVKASSEFINTDKVIRELIGDALPEDVKESETSTQTVMAASGPLQGTPYISSPYGPRQLYGSFHYGVDFAVGTGTPVQAVVSGTVVAAYWQKGGGNCVYLLGDDGYLYEYAHLSSITCAQGGRVEAGSTIASSGATGEYVTGPHLHFGVYKADEALRNMSGIGSGNLKWQQNSNGDWMLGGSTDPIKHLAEKYNIHY